MKLSTKGRYALRLMIDLAERKSDGCVSLTEIAERQNISKKYLEQIIPVLTRAGLLRTVRGAQGGYALAKSPDKCTVGEILRLTEGSLAPVDCAAEDPPLCGRSATCPVLPVYKGLYKVINDYLDGITLSDILENAQARAIDDYSI